jgi:hypothetical protein
MKLLMMSIQLLKMDNLKANLVTKMEETKVRRKKNEDSQEWKTRMIIGSFRSKEV